jgi:prolyl 4-hydroxylase
MRTSEYVLICIVVILALMCVCHSPSAPTRARDADDDTIPYRPVVIASCLTRDQCSRLIAHAEKRLARSKVVGEVVTRARTSEQAWVAFDDPDVGDIARDIRARLSALSGVLRAHLFEQIQVVRYEPSQEYRPHFDACVTRCDELRRERIPRRATLLVYLSDQFADGATHFTTIDARYKPRVGDGVLFYNVDADTGAELVDSMHAGEPVTSGTKWVCNAWCRFDHSAARA